MKPFLLPKDVVRWYLHNSITRLSSNITTDVVIVGGGMAGLSAAQRFATKGLRVILVEKYFCGAGASGKSSGFITPNAELSLHDLVSFYGNNEAKKLWDFVSGGVQYIKENIQQYAIECDYQPQDTLIVANTNRTFSATIQKEYDAYQKLGYTSTLYNSQELTVHIGSAGYTGAMKYPDSFGINGYQYCQGMKTVLQTLGVSIYEDTPVTAVDHNKVITPYGTVQAKHIVICADYGALNLGNLAHILYHVQTFLMVSAPLSDTQVKQLFPSRPYMVWDTDLIYHYFRLIEGNRLMLGGASLWYTYAQEEKHNNWYNAKLLMRYFQKKFPNIAITFPYIWPGMLGITKDILPIAGFDQHIPSVYYVAAATGLPWAAALGAYSVDCILNGNNRFDQYFSPYRSNTLGSGVQTILGTKLTFALSHFLRVGSL